MAAKILYVIINLDIGGSERQLCELISGLDRARFSPRVCCLRGGGELARGLADAGVPLTVYEFPPIDYARKLRAVRQIVSRVREVARFMRRCRPDIVHTVLPMACVTGGLAAWLARVPVLVTSRRGLGYYKEGRFFLRTLENIVNIRADAVVANSEAVRNDTLRRERIDAKKVRVIRNGVNMPDTGAVREWRELVGRDIDGPVVCLAANFFGYKGHRDFLEAAAKIRREVPNATFLLVGDGRLRADIERRAAAPDLEGSVLLLGRRSDVGDIMRRSDIVALASHEEGFPNVVLEAMAAGKPVVATRVGGVPEAVEEGKTGILVPPRNPGEMAAGLVRLLTDGEEARRMGERARRIARERFSMETMIRAYEDLYAELLINIRGHSL